VAPARRKRNVADISGFMDTAPGREDRRRLDASRHGAVMALTGLPILPWKALAENAIEPNAYVLPEWAQAIAASAQGGAGTHALAAWRGNGASARLLGVVPVISLWRAFRLPLPAFVNADPHTSLGTPLLDRTDGVAAVTALLRDARQAGAHALILRHMTIDGPVMRTLREALARDGLEPIVSAAHERAFLDATRDADELLRDGLGSRKLKELRRLRNRLAEHGDVAFEVARTPGDVGAALEVFLDLEANSWKGARGTALKQHAGDLAFIRSATVALAADGQCEIVTLRAGATPVASGIVLRHLDRAFFFKIGVDPAFARFSVGSQLTVELTRHLCADPTIASADSTAAPGHPLIDPVWRGRLAIGDVLIPLRRNDPLLPAIRFALFLRREVRAAVRRALGRKT
jgi:CelD/BcsL family acetyltransferase involved in cellulose biosynthesis